MVDLRSLNPPQREAASHIDGPALVLAGAGSGKTRVITFRIAHLIEQGIAPSNILGVTFTNKAAREMRERVAGLIDPKVARRVHLSTFHALGAALLREDIERLGFTRPFVILDESDRFRAIKDVLRELNLHGTRSNEARLLQIVSRAKNARTSPARLPEAKYNPEMPRAQRVYDLYQLRLHTLNAVDFDDLLLLPVRLLAEHSDLREKWRQRFRYIMVDEYQDTNPIQLELLQLLAAPPSPNLMVVGDDDQSIYAFRGAVSDYILRFDEFFPGTKVVALEQNYRSKGTILQCANAVIANNDKRHSKTLWSDLGDGDPVASVQLESDIDEAAYIAKRIRGQAAAQQRPWHDFAILYRVNPQARALEEALRAQQVPYRVVGGQSLFDRKEARDVLSYLRLLVNPRDEVALRRVINYPTRGLGTTTVAHLIEQARASERTLWDTLEMAVREGSLSGRAADGAEQLVALVRDSRRSLRGLDVSGLSSFGLRYVEAAGSPAAIRSQEKNANVARARWDIVRDLIDSLSRAQGETAFGALDDMVSKLSLDDGAFSSTDEDEAKGRVTLMTLHSSKGLEFPVVVMCGMSEGLLPR